MDRGDCRTAPSTPGLLVIRAFYQMTKTILEFLALNLLMGSKLYRSFHIGLIRVKEEGWTGFSEGWQGGSKEFPEGEARGKSRGAALPARGKPSPSRLFLLRFTFYF